MGLFSQFLKHDQTSPFISACVTGRGQLAYYTVHLVARWLQQQVSQPALSLRVATGWLRVSTTPSQPVCRAQISVQMLQQPWLFIAAG